MEIQFDAVWSMRNISIFVEFPMTILPPPLPIAQSMHVSCFTKQNQINGYV